MKKIFEGHVWHRLLNSGEARVRGFRYAKDARKHCKARSHHPIELLYSCSDAPVLKGGPGSTHHLPDGTHCPEGAVLRELTQIYPEGREVHTRRAQFPTSWRVVVGFDWVPEASE